jgi:hypothetical protein
MDIAQALTQTSQILGMSALPSDVLVGHLFAVEIVPEVSSIQWTDVLEQDISFDFIAKGVVFKETDITKATFVSDSEIVKILPMFNLSNVPIDLNTTATALQGALTVPPDASGTPGLLGLLAGKLPIPVSTELPVRVTVNWTVQAQAPGSENWQDLSENQDFIAPNGLSNVRLELLLIPNFVEHGGTDPQMHYLRLLAHVTLQAGLNPSTNAPYSAAKDLESPVVKVALEVGVPTVLALTQLRDFDGAALVLVPGNSPFASVRQILDLLDPLRDLLSALTSIGRFAAFLTGINELKSILQAPTVLFDKTDVVNDLGDYVFVDRPSWQFWESDITGHRVSALVLVSAVLGFKVKCEQMPRPGFFGVFSAPGGAFTVTIGPELSVLVRWFKYIDITTVPPAALLIETAPTWATFNDTLEKLHFLGP